MSSTGLRHPKIIEVRPENISQFLGRHSKLNSKYAFLHIPKTGGSSYFDFISKNKNAYESFPTPLFHTWTIRLAFQYFGDVKIICFLRDPLERIVSGFQSRSKMGLPKYSVPWSAEEAAAFALFPTVIDFLNALKGSDGRSIAATTFAMNNILAVKWNYKYYFESEEYLEALSDSLIVYELKDAQAAMRDLVEKEVIKKVDENEHNFDMMSFPTSHKSSVKSSSFLDDFSPAEIEAMRARISDEYLIYNRLSEICHQL